MADNVLFEVDASQIIAKLHLAGLQAAGTIKTGDFFINTGIKNDNPKANPDNPGKVSFDLKNSSGQYQLGYVTTVEYHKTYDLENSINDLQNYLAKTTGKDSSIKDKLDAKEQKQFDDLKTSIIGIFKTNDIKVDEKNFDTVDGIKEIRKTALDQIGEQDKKAYDDVMSKTKKDVADKLNAYLNVFAGADNVDKVDEKSMGMIDLSDKINDPNANGLVKMFEIQPASEQELAKMTAQFKIDFKKDPVKKNCKQKICFYVLYTLNIDK